MDTEKLIADTPLTTLVIGIGNRDRGDDAVGPLVSSRLKRRAGHLNVVERTEAGLSLIDAWEGAGKVIILDAVRSGAAAGQIHRIDASAHSIPADFFHCSTHAFGVAEAIELARALCKLPPRVVVYGIEGAVFEAGAEMSAAVETAADELERLILKEFETEG